MNTGKEVVFGVRLNILNELDRDRGNLGKGKPRPQGFFISGKEKENLHFRPSSYSIDILVAMLTKGKRQQLRINWKHKIIKDFKRNCVRLM